LRHYDAIETLYDKLVENGDGASVSTSHQHLNACGGPLTIKKGHLIFVPTKGNDGFDLEAKDIKQIKAVSQGTRVENDLKFVALELTTALPTGKTKTFTLFPMEYATGMAYVPRYPDAASIEDSERLVRVLHRLIVKHVSQ